jgi:glutamine synthetase
MAENNPKQELSAYLEKAPDTRYLEILAPDMNGMLRGKRTTVDEAGKAFNGGINYCASTFALDSKGQAFDTISQGSRDGDPDMVGHAVPSSLAPVPWAALPTAQCLLELTDFDGGPYFLDPRNVLRKAAQALTDMGLHPVVATELEFYLVEHDGKTFRPRLSKIPGSQLPQDGLQFNSMDDLEDVDPFLADLDSFCRAQNIPAGAALSEYSPGQFEVNLHHVDDPALACDHAVLLKRAVKAAARKNGMAATFMAKPFSGIAGSGLHIHVSLLDDDGRNVFQGNSVDGAFSDMLRHAIGGMCATMEESMAIFAPNANSYRRYSLHSFVPSTPNWGPNHRDLSLRIPLSSPENTRVEHRVSGADANPYLVLSAILAGIHHGITNQCDWPLALDAFDAGKTLPEYLGADYHKIFSTCRREESDRIHSEITNRDYEWYLRGV